MSSAITIAFGFWGACALTGAENHIPADDKCAPFHGLSNPLKNSGIDRPTFDRLDRVGVTSKFGSPISGETYCTSKCTI